MDRQERARLLLEHEETGARIRELRAALQHAGRILSALGAMLANTPEDTIFANAPPPLGHMPMRLMHGQALDWNSIPDKASIARRVQDLRELHERLDELQKKLHGSA
jgi:hypothetical protein